MYVFGINFRNYMVRNDNMELMLLITHSLKYDKSNHLTDYIFRIYKGQDTLLNPGKMER